MAVKALLAGLPCQTHSAISETRVRFVIPAQRIEALVKGMVAQELEMRELNFASAFYDMSVSVVVPHDMVSGILEKLR